MTLNGIMALFCVISANSGSFRAPFPQIDIIGAVVIVWRVRGKTIRSVLCNIVCNNCAQCDAHTRAVLTSLGALGPPG